jgi:hypothetical protein
MADWLTNNASYTEGVPGVTHDATGAVNYGGLGTPEVPVVHLADGSGGAINTFAHLNADATLHLQDNDGDTAIIRAAISDIPDGFNWGTLKSLKFREVTDCQVIDGTPTTVYRQVLCSAYYTSALGNTGV